LKEWCHYWLFTPGINGLEPVIEWNEDESIKTLKVKQTLVHNYNCSDQNILRKQLIDISLYQEDGKAVIIKDVILSDKDSITDVQVEFKGPVKAIILNYNDLAYAQMHFD
jgi:hypothetical protein